MQSELSPPLIGFHTVRHQRRQFLSFEDTAVGYKVGCTSHSVPTVIPRYYEVLNCVASSKMQIGVRGLLKLPFVEARKVVWYV